MSSLIQGKFSDNGMEVIVFVLFFLFFFFTIDKFVLHHTLPVESLIFRAIAFTFLVTYMVLFFFCFGRVVFKGGFFGQILFFGNGIR